LFEQRKSFLLSCEQEQVPYKVRWGNTATILSLYVKYHFGFNLTGGLWTTGGHFRKTTLRIYVEFFVHWRDVLLFD